MQRFSKRPDLPYQLSMLDPTGLLLNLHRKHCCHLVKWYSNAHSYLPQLQVAWVQGRYEAMWLGSLRSQIDGRWFPLSDHHIRGFSIIGEAERCLTLFQNLFIIKILKNLQLVALVICYLWRSVARNFKILFQPLLHILIACQD